VRTKCYVVLVADRGLCGAYNAAVLRAAEAELRQTQLQGVGYSLVTVGRKAESYFRFRGFRIDASFAGFTDNPTYDHARAIGQAVVDRYLSGEVDSVRLIYTRFVSAGFQEVVERPLVPLERAVALGGDGKPDPHAQQVSADYEYEPNPTVILETLLPRYVEARIWAALLNAAASEHAARQRAMKAATDNAEELIKNLTRVMNRARQDAITTEIMEIVSGAEALGADAKTDLNISRTVALEFQGVSAS
jgi:F-type H+-transporting ATPase subunit gamma